MKCTAKLICSLITTLVLTALPYCYSQDVSGMAGAVTDSSGAAIPNASVMLSNPTTGLKFTQITNGIGTYHFANLPPGQGYEATFTANGFAPVVIKNIYLTVSTIRTQNAILNVGAAAEQVEVTASNSEVTIDTTDATIGNTFRRERA